MKTTLFRYKRHLPSGSFCVIHVGLHNICLFPQREAELCATFRRPLLLQHLFLASPIEGRLFLFWFTENRTACHLARMAGRTPKMPNQKAADKNQIDQSNQNNPRTPKSAKPGIDVEEGVAVEMWRVALLRVVGKGGCYGVQRE